MPTVTIAARPRARPEAQPRANRETNNDQESPPANLATALDKRQQDSPITTEEEFKDTPLSRMASFAYRPEQSIADPKFRQAVLDTIWPAVADPKWNKKADHETCLLALVSGLCGAAFTSRGMGVHLNGNHYTGRSKGRYAVDGYSHAMVVPTVEALKEAGWLLLRPGYFDHDRGKGVCARVWPTDRLVWFLIKLAKEDADLSTLESRQAELVILKDKHKKPIQYDSRKERERSRHTRAILRQVNAANAASVVTLPALEPQARPAVDHMGAGAAAGEPCGVDRGSEELLHLRGEQAIADPSSTGRVSPLQEVHGLGAPGGDLVEGDLRDGHEQEMISSSPGTAADLHGRTFQLTPKAPPTAILIAFGANKPRHTGLYASFNNGSWKEGGRLYNAGAYGYQNLPSGRRRALLIDGEPVVELDYGSLHIAMLYADVGRQLEDDPYLAIADGDKSLRNTVAKKLVLVALNADSRKSTLERVRLDLEEDDDPAAIFAQADRWALLNRLYDRMLEVHAPIAGFLGSGVGLLLQNRDASMMLDILEEMVINRGITCLPVHDSAIVQARHEATLREVMQEVYSKHNKGFTCTVSKK
jgi:hypothetical protein